MLIYFSFVRYTRFRSLHSLMSSQFTNTDELYSLDLEKEYYIHIDNTIKDSNFYPIHKLVFFPDLLEKYIEHLKINNTNNVKDIINSVTKRKNTPLMVASRNMILKSITLLLKNGADINLKNIVGGNALHNVCYSSSINIECVKLLLNKNNNINSQTNKGDTPLLLACYSNDFGNNSEIIKLLLEEGSDIKIKDSDKKTAFNYNFKHSGEIFMPYIYKELIKDKTFMYDIPTYIKGELLLYSCDVNIQQENKVKELQKLSKFDYLSLVMNDLKKK